MSNATPSPQPPAVQPLAVWNPTRGIWESPQLDLFGQRAPCWATWWTSGMTRNGSGLPASTIGAPHPRYRVFILAHRTVPHPAGLRRREGWRELADGQGTTWDDRAQSPDHRPRPARAERIPATGGTGKPLDADRAALRRWGRYTPAIQRWEDLTGREAPAPALLNEETGPRPAPEFVEWLMGLEAGWVTDPDHELTVVQQLTALGNGVVTRQAAYALRVLISVLGRGHEMAVARPSRYTVSSSRS